MAWCATSLDALKRTRFAASMHAAFLASACIVAGRAMADQSADVVVGGGLGPILAELGVGGGLIAVLYRLFILARDEMHRIDNNHRAERDASRSEFLKALEDQRRAAGDAAVALRDAVLSGDERLSKGVAEVTGAVERLLNTQTALSGAYLALLAMPTLSTEDRAAVASAAQKGAEKALERRVRL